MLTPVNSIGMNFPKVVNSLVDLFVEVSLGSKSGYSKPESHILRLQFEEG
jgi:hypothetical protein